MFRTLQVAVMLAGFTQVAIAGSSLLIPRVLAWREETARLTPLTRHVFWTYAGYIFSTNLAFGVLSLAAPQALLDGSTLARAVCSFIAAYWIARVTLQFTVYDRSITARPLFRVAEVMYSSAFIYCGVVYATVAVLQ